MISNRSLRRRENKVKRYRGCLWLSPGFCAGLAGRLPMNDENDNGIDSGRAL
ncbi:MAG: hypothetical protein MPL62_04985 [Alphaproteobacteria bacterium]|nr:hypothetical protein [Alphaproteobacteria bacterium]